MDKKTIIRLTISTFLVLVIGVVSWQVFISPNKSSLGITKVEAASIAQNRYEGEVKETIEVKDGFIVTIKAETGEYNITISSQSGQVEKIEQTKAESPKTKLSESDVKQIISAEANGEIKTLKKANDSKNEYYEAVVENKETETALTIEVDAETGKIINKREEKLTLAEDETDNNQKDKQDKKNNKDNQQFEKNISAQEAIQIALDTVYGEVEDVDLEHSNGQLYYFIEIETADDLEAEIQIHAITGEVISIEWDD